MSGRRDEQKRSTQASSSALTPVDIGGATISASLRSRWQMATPGKNSAEEDFEHTHRQADQNSFLKKIQNWDTVYLLIIYLKG